MSKPTCSIEGCDLAVRSRGLCHRHLYRLKKYGDPLGSGQEPGHMACSVEGCERVAQARGWCKTHWKRWRRWGDPLITAYNQPKPVCSVEDCAREAVSHGWCSLHLQRWKRHGDPLATVRRPPSGLKNEICLAEDCEKPRKAMGWCAMHYFRFQHHGNLERPVRPASPVTFCSVDGCNEETEARGLCNKHYLRLRIHGDSLAYSWSEITITCWEPGCERRLAKAGVCWKHYRFYKAEFARLQGDTCAICGIPRMEASRKVLHLDHDHVTGKPRGLCCHNCNVGIGHFKDNPALLQAAIEYLIRTGSAQQVAQLPGPKSHPLPARKRRQDALAEVVPLF